MKKLILIIIFALQLNTVNAGEVKLVDIQQFKKVVDNNKKEKLLFFFASWCDPCKKAIANISANNITFISLDEEPKAIEKMAKDMKYDVYHIIPSDEYKNIYELSQMLKIDIATKNKDGGISAYYPHIAFLDANNKVLADNIDKDDLNKYLK